MSTCGAWHSATVSTSTAAAPDPEVPVFSHVSLQGVEEVAVTGAALPSSELPPPGREVPVLLAMSTAGPGYSLDIDGSSTRP